ncbi:hypothetical protein Pmani_021430 [Petrolisthes manimaculis]|uniref:Uncharacterized protein n=1 Tax=Petrolisthes manimaculis TaxID=1843537 RepID=A0AAE1PE68_9EUCA|nr:hypothetical protein Pmani_021430 [Petrolisthes manimaculis]
MSEFLLHPPGPDTRAPGPLLFMRLLCWCVPPLPPPPAGASDVPLLMPLVDEGGVCEVVPPTPPPRALHSSSRASVTTPSTSSSLLGMMFL